ncbi:MAG: S8 family serine peptidase, partial [Cytophagales bacterium]|nr:S8 family serine peptidase [Cytophagales bacterium]
MSKHYKPFLAGFIFFTHAFLCGSFAQTRFSKDEVHEKIIRVKLTEASAMKTANGISSARRLNGPISTGIEPLDQTFKQIKASEIKRVFPYAGKHEAKHRKYGLHLWYSIKYQEGKDINEVLQMFRSLDQVVVAEPVLQKQIIGYNKDAMKPANISQIYSKNGSAQPVPVNDPRLNEQWHYHNTGQSGGLAGIDIDLFEAWALETGKPNVVVSIVDGGIDINHEDLKANVWHNQAELNGTPGVDDDYNGYVDDIDGWNFTTQSAQLTPDNHGTHVAGTVGAVNNNGIGVAGIAGGGAPGTGVKLMSCQVFSHQTRPADNFAAAIVYGADNGAVISQNSWGYGGPDRFEEAVKDAIDYFTNEAGNYEGSPMRGGLVIFAAGNDDEYNTNRYPGKYEPVLAVSSIGHKGKKAYYSNYGDWVDIIAPGGETINVTHEGVLSTTINNSYAFYQGTSMACPHVSGVAALVVSKFGSPNFTGEMLRQILISSTVDINDKLDEQHAGKMGVGLIKASLALQTSG